MDWDNIILKVLFFTIIILMIMCPLRKLLVEGFDVKALSGTNGQLVEKIMRKNASGVWVQQNGTTALPGDRIQVDVIWTKYAAGSRGSTRPAGFESEISGDINGKNAQGTNYPRAIFKIGQTKIDDSRIFRKATLDDKKQITNISFYYEIKHDDIMGTIRHKITIKKKGGDHLAMTSEAGNLKNENLLKKVYLSIKNEDNLEEVIKGQTVILTILLHNNKDVSVEPQFKSGGENIDNNRIIKKSTDGKLKIEYSYTVNELDDKGDISFTPFRIGGGAVAATASANGVTIRTTTDGSKIKRVSDNFFMCKLPQIMVKGDTVGSAQFIAASIKQDYIIGLDTSKTTSGKYSTIEKDKACIPEQINEYLEQININKDKLKDKKLLQSTKNKYNLNIKNNEKMINRCIASWTVIGNRNKANVFADENIPNTNIRCQGDNCSLFSKCPLYSSSAEQTKCMELSKSGDNSWDYGKFTCVKRNALREYTCSRANKQFKEKDNDECSLCRRPISQKGNYAGDPLIENTEPVTSKESDEGIEKTSPNKSIKYKCKKGYQSDCLVDKHAECKDNHIVLNCNMGVWETLGKCRPINCKFKEGDKTTKTKDTKVKCGEQAVCIDGNTETQSKLGDDKFVITQKQRINKILNMDAPAGESEEAKKQRLNAGYKCICGYNNDPGRNYKGIHESPGLTRHSINTSPINKGLDDSDFKKKCRKGINSLLKDEGKPKFIDLKEYIKNKLWGDSFQICKPIKDTSTKKQKACSAFNERIIHMGDTYRKDNKYTLREECSKLGCQWENKEHTIICKPNTDKGTIGRLIKMNPKKYYNLINEYEKCDRINLDLMKKDGHKHLCKNRLDNRKKCELDSEIDDPDDKESKIQLCSYVGPPLKKRCKGEKNKQGAGKRDKDEDGGGKGSSISNKELTEHLKRISESLDKLNKERQKTSKQVYKQKQP
jgi:hypothetical protein